MKYGPTGYELIYMKPDVVKIQPAKTDWETIGGWVILVALLVAVMGSVFTPSIGVAHAQEPELSDHDQEVKYCQEWMHGAEVSGGTTDAITEHCKRFQV